MRMHHICIQTENYEASLKFYTEVLGFKVIKESPNFHNRAFNSWLELKGFMIELQTNKAGEVLNPYDKQSKWIVHFALFSDQFEADYQHVKAFGQVKFFQKDGQDIYHVEGGSLFKIEAPEGTVVEIRNSHEL